MGGVAGVMMLLVGLVLGIAMPGNAAAVCGAGNAVDVAGISDTERVGSWDAEQLVNAGHIMNAAAAMGLGVRAQQVGVMTAMGESSLRNIDHGDDAVNPDGSIADSIGLFQQQSSWGSTPDRLDPATSARLFFERLVAVSGWEQLAPSTAAHQVQRNSDEDHYARWWDEAVAVTDALARAHGGGAGGTCMAGEAALPLDAPYVLTSGFGFRDLQLEGLGAFHPAVDLVGQCGDPIYATLPGTVVRSDGLFLSIKSPDGFVVSYLHSYPEERFVNVGDEVTTGQKIALVGNVPPSTGCHLDIRVYTVGTSNPQVAALSTSPERPGYAQPEEFFRLFELELCDPRWCSRQ